MAQQNWTFADHVGHHYNIGLYHSTKTGHVLVYCDRNILIIDFSIRQNKKYSFFIGEQFFELDLKKQDSPNHFHYELKINNGLRNLQAMRRSLRRKYNALSVALGVVFFSALIFVTYFLTNYSYW